MNRSWTEPAILIRESFALSTQSTLPQRSLLAAISEFS